MSNNDKSTNQAPRKKLEDDPTNIAIAYLSKGKTATMFGELKVRKDTVIPSGSRILVTAGGAVMIKAPGSGPSAF